MGHPGFQLLGGTGDHAERGAHVVAKSVRRVERFAAVAGDADAYDERKGSVATARACVRRQLAPRRHQARTIQNSRAAANGLSSHPLFLRSRPPELWQVRPAALDRNDGKKPTGVSRGRRPRPRPGLRLRFSLPGQAGCPARIRTSIDGVRVRSLTIRRRGNATASEGREIESGRRLSTPRSGRRRLP